MTTRLMDRIALLLTVAAATIVLAATARWVAARPLFALRAIEVRGELQHVTSASVRAALAGRLKGNYFTMPLEETRRLLEGVPWVAGASVRRVWPNRLRVTLVEHRALGVWGDGRLLGDDGQLFIANPAEAEVHGPLPAFEGPPASAPDAARRYYEFAAQLAALAMTITGVDVSDRRSWTVRAAAADGTETTFELGREGADSGPVQRMAQIVTAFPVLAASVGGVPPNIDARYANGIVATPPAKSR